MNMNILRVRSLKARMTLSTLAIFLACMWALSLYSSTMLQADMERISGQQQFSTASMVAVDVNREIEERLKALKMTAALLSPAMIGNTPALQKYLEDHMVFQAMFNGGTFVTGLDGIATASIPLSAKRAGLSYIDRDFIVAALKGGKTSVGDPVIGKKLHSPIIVMATPILNAQGNIIGALMGVTNLGIPNFLDYVTNAGYGKNGGFLIIARKSHLIVAATDKKRIMTTTGSSPTVKRYADGYEGSAIFVNAVGSEVMVSAKIIPVANWLVVASLPFTEAFEPISNLLQRMFWATIVLSGLACGLTWWLLRRQLFPVLTVVEKLAAMANDNMPLHPLPAPEHTEVAELIHGVNRVLKTLKQRETALVESENFRRAIIDSVAAEIAVLDRHGVITAVNQPWADFAEKNGVAHEIGTQRVDIGTNYLSVCHAGVMAHDRGIALQAAQGIQAVLDQRLPFFSLEYPCELPSETLWFKMVVSPLALRSGGAVVAHTNITLSKQSDELRRLSEERLAMMQLGANDGFWDFDLMKNELFYSERWWSMLGYSNSELARDPDLSRKLMHPDDADRVNQFNSAALVGDTISYSIEFRLLHKDGHYVSVDSRGFIVRDQHGKAIRASGSNRDLTERKRAEMRLLHATATAETANVAKSHFLAAVSHDLRQPLAALTLYADMMKVDELGNNKEILPRLKDCVITLGEMLGDLLDVSKLDTGSIEPALYLVEMADILDVLQSVHTAKTANKGLRFHVHPTSLIVRTDRALMMRLIGNLIANAVEYTQDGGVLVACRRHEGKYWLEVYDTGIGIEEDKIGFIFDMFRQVNNDARNAGSGLGLYIVAKTAELLGLQIRVCSRVGHGSLFAIELPVTEVVMEDEEVSISHPPATRRIALVEDNVMVMLAMTLALEQLGHDLVAASSGKEIIELLHGQAPDLIISDYRLADGETGYDVINNLRATFGETLPAIIITGDIDITLVGSVVEQTVPVMYKPVSIEVLHAKIMQMTDENSTVIVA